MSKLEDSPVLPPTLPQFAPVRVKTPIVSNEMTIWPGPKETRREWVIGFPYELHPFAWDYMWVSCDGYSVKIKPHYRYSTWDTFWTAANGHVKADGMAGLFPFTLGKEVNLLRGIVATLEALPAHVEKTDPDAARKIAEIHDILKTREKPDVQQPEGRGLRHRVARHFWSRKLRHLMDAPLD